MPIVFVHGVANRDGEAYRENQKGRDGFVREIVAPALGIAPDSLTLFSPYWGKYGADFAWNMAALPNPGDKFESFGGNDESEARGRVAGLLAESNASASIVSEAQRDFPATVDLLYASAMAGVKSDTEASELAKSYIASANYAQKNPHPAWLANITQDNFVDQLHFVVEESGAESFGGGGGILDSIKEGLSRIVNVGSDATSAVAGRLLRKKLNTAVTRFAGDAFEYLARRGTKEAPGLIVTTVLDDLRKAHGALKPGDDKLVVIAHSFGGEIVYDIATYFDPTIEIDCLLTVGSQVGLFEEMKLYVASREGVPPNPPQGRVPRPRSVKRWVNVFDTNDVLSYRLDPIVSEVTDYYYDTGYSSFSAHSGYFMRPSFYERVAARLSNA
jgi:hypothetical protein